MAVIELTKDNLESTINGNDIVLIDFWAPWCAPCRMFGPIFEQASEKYEKMVFTKCNTDEQQEVAGSFGIRSIPTLAVFCEQIQVFQQAGALPAQALEEILEQVQKLDMDEIREKIAEEQAKQEKGA